MDLYQHDFGNSFRFVLHGALEGIEVLQLEHAWQCAGSVHNKNEFVIDLSDVDQVDDSGIDLLLRMRASGARLTAATPPEAPAIAHLLDVSGGAFDPAETADADGRCRFRQRAERMVTLMRHLVTAALLAAWASNVMLGAVLRPEAVKAWDEYLDTVRPRVAARGNGVGPFLWAGESPSRVEQLRQGGIVVEPAFGNGRIAVRDGLIHDWIGAVYLPGVSASRVSARLMEFDEYERMYSPHVMQSKVLSRDGSSARFSMTLQRKAGFESTVIQADYETSYSQPEAGRWWAVSRSTRVQEVEHYGRPDMRLQPVGLGAGYIWRLYSATRVMDFEGGCVVEIEAVALSRDVPAAIAWLVNPIVSRISRSALTTTLSQTRLALAR